MQQLFYNFAINNYYYKMGKLKSVIKNLVGSWIFDKEDGIFYTQSSSVLGQKGPVWIDTTKPKKLYDSIPQLKSVINRKAVMFSNMELYVIDIKSKKRIEDKELDKLLQNPNPLQAQNGWLRQFKEQEQVYGNHFLYKNNPSKLATYPVTLWNISPALMQPVTSGKMFDQLLISDIITGYNYQLGGVTKTFDTNDILYSRIADLDNPIIGMSCIHALKYPLSNIEAAYEYRNVIMKEKGALGILSNNSKDAMGAIPLGTEERERLEKTYTNRYGISKEQSKVILTEASLTWTPMSYPTKDMLLFEEVDANLITIIDAFGLNVNMFSNKQATFENVKQSIVQVYQDTIIPEADQFTQALSKFLKLPEDKRLVASYDHLAIMKENKLKGMVSLQTVIASLKDAVEAGLLDKAKAMAILSTELGLT